MLIYFVEVIKGVIKLALFEYGLLVSFFIYNFAQTNKLLLGMKRIKLLFLPVVLAGGLNAYAASSLECALSQAVAESESESKVSKEEAAAKVNEAKGGLKKVMQIAAPSVNFGGYITGKYSITDRSGVSSNGGFDLRFLRLYLDGNCFKDFFYRLQLEACGSPGVDKGPRILDAFVEWQKLDFLKIKMGQFKRPFGFENPYSPLNVGLGAYSQATTKLASISDWNGEHSSGGRDLGAQIQGDLFPGNEKGHYWFHYQLGVFNGQGINHADKDNFKDVIGGVWFSPLKELSIGAFGWNGRYTNESYTGAENTLKQVKRVRWGTGIKYESDWTVRSEYMSSVGGSVKDATAPDRADSWYATIGVPVVKNLKLYGRWDVYRNAKTWDSMKTDYGLSANYFLGKNFILQLNYTFTDDRWVRNTQPLLDSRYNTFDFQIYARF